MRQTHIEDGKVVTESSEAYRLRTAPVPGVTKQHRFALRDSIQALQQARDENDGRRYGYFAAGGWAGERLRELLQLLDAATSAD